MPVVAPQTMTMTPTMTMTTTLARRRAVSAWSHGSVRWQTTERAPPLKYEPSLRESFRTWYEELCNYDDGDMLAQDRFLGYVLPYYRPKELVEDAGRPLRAFSVRTPLRPPAPADLSDSNQWYLHEVRVEKRGQRGEPAEGGKHLVMLHGYGASSGWFYKNYTGIAEQSRRTENLTIHGLDMLGFGLSGRPGVRFRHDADTKPSLEIATEGISWPAGGRGGGIPVCASCGGHLDGKHRRGGHWCSCSAEEEVFRRGETTTRPGAAASIVVRKEDVYEYVQNQRALVAEVEDVYVESLEAWRAANGIEVFDLVAHSLGGYLGLCYVLRYPERVGRIVLASPGGVERSPFAVSNPRYEQIAAGEQGLLRTAVSNDVAEYGFLGRYGLVGGLFRLAWRMRLSVFTLLRWLGPWGPYVLAQRNAPRLARSGNIQDRRELALLLRYVYSCCCVRASFSETSIMRLFDATVVGRVPLLDKIREDAGRQLAGKDVLWVYGEHDFMYGACGPAAVRELEAACSRGGGDGDGPGRAGEYRLRTVANAGHNMYLDNAAAFDAEVVDFLRY